MKQLFFRRKNTVFTSQKPLPPLYACLLMDALGCASYLVPFLGEVADLLWAPLSAIVYFRMFGGAKGMLGGAFSFIEELLPGMDFIPTFTITWFLMQKKRAKNTINLSPVR